MRFLLVALLAAISYAQTDSRLPESFRRRLAPKDCKEFCVEMGLQAKPDQPRNPISSKLCSTFAKPPAPRAGKCFQEYCCLPAENSSSSGGDSSGSTLKEEDTGPTVDIPAEVIQDQYLHAPQPETPKVTKKSAPPPPVAADSVPGAMTLESTLDLLTREYAIIRMVGNTKSGLDMEFGKLMFPSDGFPGFVGDRFWSGTAVGFGKFACASGYGGLGIIYDKDVNILAYAEKWLHSVFTMYEFKTTYRHPYVSSTSLDKMRNMYRATKKDDEKFRAYWEREFLTYNQNVDRILSVGNKAAKVDAKFKFAADNGFGLYFNNEYCGVMSEGTQAFAQCCSSSFPYKAQVVAPDAMITPERISVTDFNEVMFERDGSHVTGIFFLDRGDGGDPKDIRAACFVQALFAKKGKPCNVFRVRGDQHGSGFGQSFVVPISADAWSMYPCDQKKGKTEPKRVEREVGNMISNMPSFSLLVLAAILATIAFYLGSRQKVRPEFEPLL